MASSVRGMKAGIAAIVLALLGAGGLLAASGPEIRVHLAGSVQSAARTGVAWTALNEGAKVAPGEKILYKVELTNQGDQEARKPMALGPVPAGTAFVPGTASTGADLKIDYSLDGGKTFAEKPTVQVTGKDGKLQVVPAPPERYTTIRWTWDTPLAPGATSTVSYQVQVR
jgi:uncharacterized repeat protein (TIGR01451 family)